MTQPTCRFCQAALVHTFADLGRSPLANSFLPAERLGKPEPFHPLRAWVCGSCFLVQLQQFEGPERIFDDYAYFSSYSDSWLEHARAYADAVALRFSLDASRRVVEIASNDGYLLRFLKAKGLQVLGIEPAKNVARVAEAAGVPTLVEFFGARLARSLADAGQRADLLIANNVLAHVPELNDFVSGLASLLAERGVATLEFPHLLRLIERNQFDTIYHEHFSYFSLRSVRAIFEAHGLAIFDVEELATHGGSLRIYARHAGDASKPVSARVEELVAWELKHGVGRLETYTAFQERVLATKQRLLDFLHGARRAGKSVAGYGAPAKGNTLLNFCGIGTDLVAYTVDRSPYKQGLYLPGTHLPIHSPDRIRETRPDYVLILPWNLRDEITEQMAWVRDWGGRFVVAVPELEIID